jgi:hypothetical protein
VYTWLCNFCQAAKDVVEGTFLEKHGNELKNILLETKQLIKEMSMPEEIKVLGEKINCEISEDDFISGFKKWKESTSTTPSEWHLGHYKGFVYHLDLKKQEPKKQHLCECKTNFVKALVKLINVLHLFKAEYNLSLKLIWGSQMVHQGEDNNCFGK